MVTLIIVEKTGYASNGVAFYVGSSLMVHNSLFFVHKLCPVKINAKFLLVEKIKMIGMLLNIVHPQV